MENIQKISFCQAIELLLSKHLNKETNEIDEISIIIFLKYVLNILLVFCLNKNDELFYKRIIEDNKNYCNSEFFHGKSDESREISKLSILISKCLIKLNSNKNEKNINDLLNKNFKLMSLSLNYPDSYVLGIKRAVNKNIDLYVNLLKTPKNFSSLDNRIIQFLEFQSEKLNNEYRNYYMFKRKIEDLYETVEISISEVFQKLNVENYLKKKIHISGIEIENNSGGYSEKCIIQNEKNFADDERKNTEFYLLENPELRKKDGSLNYDDYYIKNYLMLKSNYIFSILDLLKINIIQNQLHQEIQLPFKTFDYIIKLLNFFIKNNPDNCIVLMNKTFLKFMKRYIKNHFEAIFNLYYQAVIQIITPDNEFPNTDNIFDFFHEFLIVIKEDPLKYPFLRKVLKFYELIVNNFSTFNEKFILIVTKKIIEIYELFPFIKNYIIYLVNLGSGGNENEIEISESLGNSLLLSKKMSSKIRMNRLSSFSSIKDSFLQINKIRVFKVEKIYGKYIKILNDVFDSRAYKYEEFLFKFIDLESIKIILKNNIDLFLRTQLLRYFRILYIYIFIDPNRNEIVKTRFNIIDTVNDKKRKSLKDKIEEIYQFLAKLSNFSDLEKNFDLEYKILKKEIINFELIIKNQIKENNIKTLDKLLYYLENGLILPLKVFYNKFLIIIREKTSKCAPARSFTLKIQKEKIENTLGLKKNSDIHVSKTIKKVKFETIENSDNLNEMPPLVIQNLNYSKKKLNINTNMFKKEISKNIEDYTNNLTRIESESQKFEEINLINRENENEILELKENKNDILSKEACDKIIKEVQEDDYFSNSYYDSENDEEGEKFDSYERNKNGVKNIKFYEFTLHFLFLKHQIINLFKDKSIINESLLFKNEIYSKNIDPNRILQSNNLDIFNINDKVINNGMSKEFLNIHEKKTQLLLNLHDIQTNFIKLKEDIQLFQDDNFELFDQIKISTIFE